MNSISSFKLWLFLLCLHFIVQWDIEYLDFQLKNRKNLGTLKLLTSTVLQIMWLIVCAGNQYAGASLRHSLCRVCHIVTFSNLTAYLCLLFLWWHCVMVKVQFITCKCWYFFPCAVEAISLLLLCMDRDVELHIGASVALLLLGYVYLKYWFPSYDLVIISCHISILLPVMCNTFKYYAGRNIAGYMLHC